MSDLKKVYEKVFATQSVQYNNINDSVLLVDGLNFFIRCFAATPTMNDDGEHVGGVIGFLKSLALAIRTLKPSRCIIAFDGKGGSQRRRKLFPEYKENRQGLSRLNRTYDFKDKPAEVVSMKRQMILLAHLLKHLPVTVIAPNNVEADDVIAYLAKTIEGRNGQVTIMSTDKDFLQIISQNISVWNPIKKSLIDVKTVLDKYGIHPNNFVFYRALDGDKTDNIPGVKGIGHKILLRMYPQLSSAEKVSVNEIVDYAERQKKGKLFKRIIDNKDLLERNILLMNLNDPMISTELKIKLIDRLDEIELVLNKKEFLHLLVSNKITTAFKNYDSWMLTSFQQLMRFSDGR